MEADLEAYAHSQGNIAAIAGSGVVAGQQAAGMPVPDLLIEGWTGVPNASRRTLQRLFTQDLTLAERAAQWSASC